LFSEAVMASSGYAFAHAGSVDGRGFGLGPNASVVEKNR
jgi:hypothetical protein